jgi:hypothetical protein
VSDAARLLLKKEQLWNRCLDHVAEDRRMQAALVVAAFQESILWTSHFGRKLSGQILKIYQI